uniref:Uncharacterized protein n=1 Tax=Ciona intestinalis TaxID=7719 RepID=H2XLD5_CIOIN
MTLVQLSDKLLDSCDTFLYLFKKYFIFIQVENWRINKIKLHMW